MCSEKHIDLRNVNICRGKKIVISRVDLILFIELNQANSK